MNGQTKKLREALKDLSQKKCYISNVDMVISILEEQGMGWKGKSHYGTDLKFHYDFIPVETK